MQYLPKQCVWAGMALMLVTGFAHLIAAPDAFDEARYKGLLFLAGVIGAFLAATGIQEGALLRGWVLGALVAGATVAGFIAAGMVGLPGLAADPQVWRQPLGIVALVSETLMLLVVLWAYEAARHSRRRIAAT